MWPLNKILITCKEATLLIGKEQEHAITLREKFNMHLHLLFCKVCALFYKQSNHLHTVIKQLASDESVTEQISLDEDKKATLEDLINRELKK